MPQEFYTDGSPSRTVVDDDDGARVMISIHGDAFRSLLRLARECAEDLQTEIDARYPEDQRADQPSSERRWMRDRAVTLALLDLVIRFETRI